jgi:predicted HTH domain antitoxin
MHTHALTVALTLYRSGTLTLEQAAESAGLSEPEMRAAIRRHGIPLHEELAAPAGDRRPASAD